MVPTYMYIYLASYLFIYLFPNLIRKKQENGVVYEGNKSKRHLNWFPYKILS